MSYFDCREKEGKRWRKKKEREARRPEIDAGILWVEGQREKPHLPKRSWQNIQVGNQGT